MAKKSKKSSEKVNDVSKPGETPDSSNARPTITGHNPTVKNDPMVAFSSNDESKEKDTKKDDSNKSYKARSKIVISPISKDSSDDEKKEDKKTESPETEENTDTKAAEAADENANEDTDKDEKAEETEEKSPSAGSDSAAIDVVAQTADAKKAESKQEEEEKKHQEYIDGLVKGGKYRLPIIEGGHKGSAERFISWIFFILLIVSITVYLAIDAGYLDVGFNVPFEFVND